MRQESLPFGATTVDVELPDRAVILRPGESPPPASPTADLAQLVRAALDQSLGLPRVEDCVRAGRRVVIAFDDPTVRTSLPVRGEIIGQLLERLASGGVDEGDVTLICANALHRKWTSDELARVLGQDLVDRFAGRLLCHDAEDWDNLAAYGQTASGHHVDLSRLAADADLCIYVNAGCFMGFSGGWKSVAVGLSTYRSIAATHHPDGMSMSVRHNRMHVVLDEMGAQLEQRLGKRFYKVETVMAGPERAPDLGRRCLRDARRRPRCARGHEPAAALFGARPVRRGGLRRRRHQPLRDLCPLEPDPRPDFVRARLSGRLH